MVEVVKGKAAPEPVASVPQMMLPLASVSRASVQERTVCICSPPPVRTRPFTVEEALVALRRVVWIPPANVLVAPVLYALK